MAFFTRSSAANIPVNLRLCKELGLDEEKYSVSIPLGATINMAGAAITISVLTLAAANTLGISVDFPTAFLLSVVASIAACGSSGFSFRISKNARILLTSSLSRSTSSRFYTPSPPRSMSTLGIPEALA